MAKTKLNSALSPIKSDINNIISKINNKIQFVSYKTNYNNYKTYNTENKIKNKINSNTINSYRSPNNNFQYISHFSNVSYSQKYNNSYLTSNSKTKEYTNPSRIDSEVNDFVNNNNVDIISINLNKKYFSINKKEKNENDNKYSILSKRYDLLKNEYESWKNKQLEKLRKELRDIEKKISQEMRQHKSCDLTHIYNNKNNLKKLKKTYESLKRENNQLKGKIENYSKYLSDSKLYNVRKGRNNGIVPKNIVNKKLDIKTQKDINDIIKAKEKQVNEFKENIQITRKKEKERFKILINKYDKTLISQEKENTLLKMKLKELERQFI